jgi:hypothetical protein
MGIDKVCPSCWLTLADAVDREEDVIDLGVTEAQLSSEQTLSAKR